MAVIGNLIIGIEATTQGLRKGVQEAEGIIGQAGKTLGTLGSIAGQVAVVGLGAAAVGIAAVAASMPSLISMGSDAEEMMGKYNVVFGAFAEGTTKELDGMANRMGRSKFEMREFAASFQDTFVPMGFARGEAAKLSTQLVELTYDVASFNNAQESDVARDFQSAIVGNTETVKKYGIVINQSRLDQELLNMGVAGGVQQATEAEKVQARLNLIMAGTTDAQGDAERTSESWANQMRALKAVVSDTGKEIGLALLPVVTPLLSRFRELAQKYAPQVKNALTGLISTLSGVSQYFGAVLAGGEAVNDWLTQMPEGIQGVVQGFGAAIVAFREGGLSGLGQYVVDELGKAWNDSIWPELQTWPGKFWGWLTAPETGVLAKATVELNKLPAAITDWAKTFNWVNVGSGIGDGLIDAVGDKAGEQESGETVIKGFLKGLVLAFFALDETISRIGAAFGIGLVGSIAKAIGGEEAKNIITTKLTDLLTGSVSSVFGLLMMGTGWGGLITTANAVLGYASGGVVPGTVGGPAQLAMVHPGEVIIPAGGSAATTTKVDRRVYINTLNLMGVQDVGGFLAELEALS